MHKSILEGSSKIIGKYYFINQEKLLNIYGALALGARMELVELSAA